MSQLQNFYSGQNIFITGSTGFLGQVLLEKLLRNCPGIKIIYILIRTKKGKNERERIDALLAGPLFDKLRSKCPKFAEKIVLVPGDIAQEGLGISAFDYERIVNEVSVIFHLAATVRFNEKLDVAVTVNVHSAKHIVDIAKACTNLKAAAYVSTAYSHCVRNQINEELYPPPLSYEAINELIESTAKKENSEDALNDVTEKVLGEWPNTYTFTKAIAESVVADYAGELPFVIFRPSIISCIHEDPVPGWLFGLMGPVGISVGIGVGIIHTLRMNLDLTTDIVPVDYVCNALISCAWERAITEQRNNENIPVYNYVCEKNNPITWKRFVFTMDTLKHIYPSNMAVYYSFVIVTKSKFLFVLLEFFLHIIPALLTDNVARLFGKEPRMYKIMQRIRKACRDFDYFSMHAWDFENRRVQNLWKRLTPEDKRIFMFSMQNIDWDDHCMKMIKGIGKYVLGEAGDKVEEARRRSNALFIVHSILCLVLAMFFSWITWKLLQGIGLMSSILGVSA